jgi:CRP-like cAMP-binding protein
VHERPRPRENHLLSRLPPAEFQRIRRELQVVRLPRKQILQRPGEPIVHVFFPINGVCSAVSIMEDGSTVEVATVGRDGLVGLSLFFDSPVASFQVYSQIPGLALRMGAELFLEEAARSEPFQWLLRRYAQARYLQTAQSAACNRLHSVEQRCARWLLMTHDRVGADRFQLTHEFFAQILGVRRASVTLAARTLQQAGAIRYVYGVITVIDRSRLESAACECFGVIAAAFKRLLEFGGD